MKIKNLIFTLLGMTIGINSYAQMNVGQGNLNVETRVQEICELYATQLNFGVIDFVQSNGSVTIPGNLSIRCTKGVNYKVKVSQEGIASDGFRKLKNKNNIDRTANYNLFLLGTNQLFGDGVVGKNIEGVGTGLKQQVKYEAKIQFDQTVEAGFYEDTINIYLDY